MNGLYRPSLHSLIILLLVLSQPLAFEMILCLIQKQKLMVSMIISGVKLLYQTTILLKYISPSVVVWLFVCYHNGWTEGSSPLKPGFHIIGRIAALHETVHTLSGRFHGNNRGPSGRSIKRRWSWLPTSSCIEHSLYEHSFVRSGDPGDYMETRLKARVKRWWTICSSVVITNKESDDHLERNVISLQLLDSRSNHWKH